MEFERLSQSTATLVHPSRDVGVSDKLFEPSDSAKLLRDDLEKKASHPSVHGVQIDLPDPKQMVFISDQMVSAGTSFAHGLPVPVHKPDLIINKSARSMLTDRMQSTINRLLPALGRVAEKNYISVSKVEISGFVEPEEGDQEVVVTQWVKVSPQVALEYWDKMGAAVEAWIEFLPDDVRTGGTTA